MKLAYKIAALIFSICPFLLQADDTDIGKFGHVISNTTDHPVHIHLDISGGSDAELVVPAGGAWRTGKTGKINKFEIRDYESGLLMYKLSPAEDGGKYQVLYIRPGTNNGKYKGNKYFSVDKAVSRYQFDVKRLHDRF